VADFVVRGINIGVLLGKKSYNTRCDFLSGLVLVLRYMEIRQHNSLFYFKKIDLFTTCFGTCHHQVPIFSTYISGMEVVWGWFSIVFK
jgi:hypothetical protein